MQYQMLLALYQLHLSPVDVQWHNTLTHQLGVDMLLLLHSLEQPYYSSRATLLTAAPARSVSRLSGFSFPLVSLL